jgi:hypothetical protein
VHRRLRRDGVGHIAGVYANSKPINFWKFPNDLAGDLFVTLLVQTLLTVVIGSMTQWGDVKKGLVAPIAPTALPRLCCCMPPRSQQVTRSARGARWLATSDDLVGAYTLTRPVGGTAAMAGAGAVRPSRPRLLANTLLRALLYVIPSFLFWVVAVIICVAIWGSSRYNHFPQVPVIFAVYGAVIGLIQTPILALITLVNAALLYDTVAPAAGGAVLADGVPTTLVSAGAPATAGNAGATTGASLPVLAAVNGKKAPYGAPGGAAGDAAAMVDVPLGSPGALPVLVAAQPRVTHGPTNV